MDMPTNFQSGYAPVNGLDLYYEVYGADPAGTSVPLVLLHGGLCTTAIFAPFIPSLSASRKVIAVELQAHGHTADIDRPLSYELMADDIAALLAHLAIDRADIFGYSLGAGVTLQVAIRHPRVVNKLVIASTTFARQGWYPETLTGMSSMNAEAAAAMTGSFVHEAYVNAAPRPQDWPVLVTKLGAMLSRDYDWTESVREIKAPTLLVFGDADSVRLSHAIEMYGLLGGGKADGATSGIPASHLTILPATAHWDVIARADLLLPIIQPFLAAAAPLPAPEYAA